jgi:adenine deaminase
MKIDLIIKNAYVFQTFRQCFEKKDIAILGDKFYYIAPKIRYDAVQILDCTDKYIIPGLIDIHMHIESSMTFPIEFSKTVLPHGTTTVVADAHEMANVFGIAGMEAFMEQDTALDIFYAIPSSVPSTSEEMETSGGIIEEKDVLQLISNDKILCLGEVMNYKALIAEQSTKIKDMIQICKNHNKNFKIEGHCPKLSHEDTAKFIYAGVDSDHTQQTANSLMEKIDLGMFVELQKKSLSKEVVEVIEKHQLYECISLVTDDTMPDDLLKGQLNRVMKQAIALGMPIEKAIYIATHTPARRMELSDRGVIAPGKKADFIILDQLDTLSITEIYKNGVKYEEAYQSKQEVTYGQLFPTYFYHSVQCKHAIEQDFEIKTEKDCNRVLANVIQIAEFGTFTKKIERELQVKNQKVLWKEAGLSLITIFERYGKTNQISHGFVENAFIKEGAVATTWSHDSHNLFVIGNSIKDMVKVQNHIVDIQGGYSFSVGGQIKASANLRVGGIISDSPVKEVGEQIEKVRNTIEQLGYKNNNVIMSIATLSLLVSPELKMSDKGLFDVKTQTFESLLKYID